jgi:hypothetical protein
MVMLMFMHDAKWIAALGRGQRIPRRLCFCKLPEELWVYSDTLPILNIPGNASRESINAADGTADTR